ncbi:3-hydroxyacyl-CoA dehydrogenase/enoyl-CoA hydratase family protein [Paenibacillus macquariensis]|uniref:3-hydroxyacyl-CoA dehydrogenase n=1 Tax=Paenibacillus macquariensis TaxID=948756 RepID=A0ABY1K1R9_9BACL|nr:3-hydroxyacyl-CoA dehydrogenase/enoyl-CoA hydratase family protein [Paenibacillus macquariensis]MEC0091726.1 3-hydroxyacyl-CoA dehydrogenase/enoyl-CoA hydratase family protein [Paenibacillus macquariensis]OAB32348.1 3-hydroxyacyl-CoA dehydrogenase [Paenibacillus macquariensis subsp. macquariensis]SIR13209.1 3-hydroxyacyl-CoA dehydrogenase [Paenibacillus macquariensis]
MNKSIRKAAVIGSGIMGSGIAAHLANVGISCLLLDMVPKDLTEEEVKKGYTLEHPAVRNRLATGAIAKLHKNTPSPLYDNTFSKRITPGNLSDHLERISEVDWVIEVVVENLQVKKELLSKVERYWKPGTIVSSNTSGISIQEMVADCSEPFQQSFLGTHFFNPPRYMKLLEIIPGTKTDPGIVQQMKSFCESTLGKGVVVAKDTPNFIANRIGTYGLLITLQEMLNSGFSVEEVDAVTGPAMGRPKSATFRTLDMVGLDTFVHVADNVYANITSETEKAAFAAPDALTSMVSRGWFGEKSGQGFYLKKKGANGSEIWSLDLSSMEYHPQKKVTSGSLEAARMAKGARAKTKALIATGDRYSELAWNILKQVLLYSAEKVGEIANSIHEIDEAMKWGFNWELGPFETWDALGLVRSVERMEKEGLHVPSWVKEWIAAGNQSFYQKKEGTLYYVSEQNFKLVEQPPEIITLSSLKEQNKIVKGNDGASLIDLGDGVACLEFHSPNNAIGADILMMIQQSMEEVRNNFEGMVIANQGRHFCVGANIMLLLMEAQDEEWDEIDGIIRLFQNTMYKVKRFEKPVVAAPHRMTLGGGVEACMPADQVIAGAETYYGLVEVGVGLIPAGGGCKELAMRASQRVGHSEADIQPYINHIYETVGMAKVSTSGHDAQKLGYLRSTDRIIANQDHLIYEAKQAVLRMSKAGYEPIPEEKIRVAGSEGKAVLQLGAIGMRESGYISDHDLLIAKKLAHVLAGGNIPAGTLVSEQYMLDLEREAFLSLCGELKTQQRMQHMLTKGKALRN